MKVLENTTVYKCEHCNKVSISKSAMKSHECACKKNPTNVPKCDDCYWFENATQYNGEFETEHFDVMFNEGLSGAKSEPYDIAIQTCPFYGKLYFKLYGSVAAYVEAEGWMKKPSKVQGCHHYLSIEDASKIRTWGNKKYEKQLGWFGDYKVTPQSAYEYFTEIGDKENARRFGPKEENGGGK